MLLSALFFASSLTQPVATGEDLRTHLCAEEASPLDALSVAGKIRFLESLRFGRGGLASFRTTPLEEELTKAERDAIGALLGITAYTEGMTGGPREASPFRSDGLPAAWSSYCAEDEELQTWTLRARADHEGILSAIIAAVNARVSEIGGDGLPVEAARQRRAEIAKKMLPLRDVEERVVLSPGPVARDLTRTLIFQAEQTEDRRLIRAALRAHRALEARGLSDDVDTETLTALAEALARSSGDLRVRTVENGEMVESHIPDADRVVFVGSSACGFCRIALGAVSADPALLALMDQHALLLTPPGEDITSPWHRMWAEDHPELAYSAAVTRSDWEGIAFDRTPHVYLVKSGEPELIIDGWPPSESAGRLETLKSALLSLAGS